MTLAVKITRRSAADVALVTEALILLLIFRIGLAVVPVRKIIKTITRRDAAVSDSPSAPGETASERDREVIRKVQWAVSAAARHSLVKFLCFPQTLAGYILLRRRKVVSTMIYGVARSPKGGLIAHTWLKAGGRIVTGGDTVVKFSEVERWT